MNDKLIKGRLVTILAKGFLGFTAAVIAVSLFTIWLSNLYYMQITKVPDIDGLRSNQNLLAEKYEKVSAEKYLGKEGAFAVLSADGKALYRSAETMELFYTPGELACILSYDELTDVDHTSFLSKRGTREHLFIKYNYDEDYNLEEKVMILNEKYEVVGGGFEEGKLAYTPEEVSFLMGESHPGFELLQCRLDAERTLLVISRIQDYEYYNHLAERANRIFLVVIPLYLAVLTAFLIWISRKIKNPLVELNRIIESRSGGNNARAGLLEGPWEIRQIGKTFDRMMDQLEASEAERKRLDHERQKMLAAISHDLKTPVTVISGYARAICDGKIPENQLDVYLQRIEGKSAELNDLVNSFHELSKVEHPNFVLHPEKTDVCEFLRTYLAERYDDIEFHGFSLRAVIPEACCVYCMMDAPQIRRALDNVLYNTLRHNSLGTVLTVGLSPISRGIGDVPCVRIFIADNGSGIAPELREKIFEPFVTGDESRTGRGSGLGLSITKNIIQAHGGDVRLCVPPQSGSGAEFEILLKVMEEK